MKKILVLFTTFFFALTLSGCDFIDKDTIDKATEEYCRENPETDICKGESVKDIEDEIIKNIFITMRDNPTNYKQEEYCEKYISLSNISLLDQCRDDASSFFPKDYKDYEIVEVLSSSEGVFAIKTLNSTLQKEATFRISLTIIDGVKYVSDWSYTIEDSSNQNNQVPLLETKTYLEKLIQDLQNSTVDSETYCQNYSLFDSIEQCTLWRENRINNNLVVSLNTFVDFNGYYKVEIKVNSDYEVDYIISGTAEFFYDSNDVVHMDFTTEDYPIDVDAKTYFKTFVDAVNNDASISDILLDFSVLTDNQEMKSLIEQLRYLEVEITNYEVSGIGLNYYLKIYTSDSYVYEYNVTFSTTSKITSILTYSNSNPLLRPYYVSKAVSDFVEEVTLNGVTNNICETIFDSLSISKCLNDFSNIVYNNIEITSFSIEYTTDYYIVTLQLLIPDGTSTVYSFKANFYTEGEAVKIGYIDPQNYISSDAKDALIWEYQQRFNDLSSYTDEEVCELLYDTDSYECSTRRSQILNNNSTIGRYNSSLSLYPLYIDFGVYNSLNQIEYYLSYKLDFSFNENGDVVMKLSSPTLIQHFSSATIENTYLDPAIGSNYIHQFVLDFNDRTISHETFCITHPNIIKNCEAFRSGFFMHNETLEVENIEEPFDSREYFVILNVIDANSSNVGSIDYLFFIYNTTDNVIATEGYQRTYYHRLFDLTEVQNILENFLEDFFDKTISDLLLYEKYEISEMQDGFSNRGSLIDNITTYQINTVQFNQSAQTSLFSSAIEYTFNNQKMISTLYFSVGITNNGTNIVYFSYDTPLITTDVLRDISDKFLLDLDDTTISNEEFCTTYFQNKQACIVSRQEYLENGYSYSEGSRTTLNEVYFEIKYYDGDIVPFSEIRYYVTTVHDLFGNEYKRVSYEMIPKPVLEEISAQLQSIIESVNDGSISLNSYCTTYIDCEDAFNPTNNVTILSVNLITMYSFWSESITAEIVYAIENGNNEAHYYNIYYDFDQNGLHFEAEYFGKIVEIPNDAVLQDVPNTSTILDLFIIDVMDTSISDTELCDTYFNGSMLSEDCFEGRKMMLLHANGIDYTILNIDETNNIYEVEFRVEYQTYTETFVRPITVYYLPTTSSYYIFFVPIH